MQLNKKTIIFLPFNFAMDFAFPDINQFFRAEIINDIEARKQFWKIIGPCERGESYTDSWEYSSDYDRRQKHAGFQQSDDALHQDRAV